MKVGGEGVSDMSLPASLEKKITFLEPTLSPSSKKRSVCRLMGFETDSLSSCLVMPILRE